MRQNFITYKESLIDGLEKLLFNPKCFLFGEDVEDPYGGAYAISKGLSSKYPGKVINTPMSEQGFTGMGVGMALAGYYPIIEIMFGDFSTLIMDQILNHASKFQEGFEKDLHFVVRLPMGGYRGYGATHSQSLEKLFVGLPNIYVISPSVLHAPGPMLVDSLNLGIPVVFIENKLDYTRKLFVSTPISKDFEIKSYGGKFPIVEATFPDEKPETAIITYGGLVHPILELVHDIYFEEEIPVKVVALSNLSPFDFDAVYDLVKDQITIITVEEGHVPFGIGDGIISNLAQKGKIASYYCIGAKQHIIGSSRSSENNVLPQMDSVKTIILDNGL